jgi:hypothetical protein
MLGWDTQSSMPPTARSHPRVPRAFEPSERDTYTRICTYEYEGINPARRLAFSKEAGESSLVIQSPL